MSKKCATWQRARKCPHCQATCAVLGRERHVAEFGCQLAAAPVRRAVAGGVLKRSVQNPSIELGHRRPGSATRMQRHQLGQPMRLERPRPLQDELVVAGELAANVDQAFSVAPKHNAPCTARQGGIAVTPSITASNLARCSIVNMVLCMPRYLGAIHRDLMIQWTSARSASIKPPTNIGRTGV